MAFCALAAGSTRGRGGLQSLRSLASLRPIAAALALAAFAAPASAASNNVRITGLADLAFGSISSFSTDSTMSENVCVYSSTALNNYQITATGGGSGGGFALKSLSYPSASLAYEVQWSASSGQTSGTSLSAGVALTGQHSNASQQTCNSGPASSASLIVIIRAAAVDAAIAEPDYSGTLTLTVAPE